jgi:hypothetical protein
VISLHDLLQARAHDHAEATEPERVLRPPTPAMPGRARRTRRRSERPPAPAPEPEPVAELRS